MLKRSQWLDLARKLDWEFSYVSEEDVFPTVASGTPWLPHEAWKDWDEPFRTSYAEYVQMQSKKEASLRAVKEVVGGADDLFKLPPTWINALKLHAATLPLAEFAAVIGNLRSARFGRDGAWRTMSTLGALDEMRHTQIPLGEVECPREVVGVRVVDGEWRQLPARLDQLQDRGVVVEAVIDVAAPG